MTLKYTDSDLSAALAKGREEILSALDDLLARYPASITEWADAIRSLSPSSPGEPPSMTARNPAPDASAPMVLTGTFQRIPADPAQHERIAGEPAGSGWQPIIAEIAVERCRQVEVEGWTDLHDDEHGNGEMCRAAAAYAYEAGRTEHQRMIDARIYAAGAVRGEDNGPFPPSTWPWSRECWKPKNPRRDLIRAAALIVAEIERLDRAAPPHEKTGETA